jgi:hypothetical protein
MDNSLEQLKQAHRDLDTMIQELHERHYPDNYIKPYKLRKLTLKTEIDRIENEQIYPRH